MECAIQVGRFHVTAFRTGWLIPDEHAMLIFPVYFKNTEATQSTLTPDGWLRTGDLCYIDEDGYLFVVDRLKELIKYKGYQVSIIGERAHLKYNSC